MKSIPIVILIMSFATGCGNNSTVQRDSSSCEETGRVTVPANPETGAPSRCVTGATQEQICNLKDMKHDPVTNACVSVTDSDMRMLYLDDAYSALRRLDREVIPICIGGDAWESMPADQRPVAEAKLIDAVTTWLTPLQDVGLGEFTSRLSVVETSNSCPEGFLAKVEIVSATDQCHGRRGCVLPETSTMYLRAGDGMSEAVILHEFGHIFGLGDLYIDTAFRPDEPPDSVTGCLKGFFGSTMCHDRPELGPADIAGIRNMYCSLTKTANCQEPGSWANAFFGTNLAFCSTATGYFALIYDRKRAVAGLPPYGGVFSVDSNSRLDVVAADTEKSFEVLDLITTENPTTLKWNIKAATLDNHPLSCSVLSPWLKKL